VDSTLDVEFDTDGFVANLHAEVSTITNESNADIFQSVKEHWHTRAPDGTTADIPFSLLIAIQDSLHDQLVAYFSRGAVGNQPTQEELSKTITPDLKVRLKNIARFCGGMKYYGASQFTNPGSCRVAFEIGEDGQRTTFRARQEGHTRILFDMYQASRDPENSRYQQFLDIVGPHGLKLIDSLSFKRVLTSSSDTLVRLGGDIEKRKNKRYLVVPTVTIGKRHLSPNQLSEGTFKTLVLLFHIMTTESTALLIEEPEVCIHHGLLSSVLELIKIHSREKIIILTTHSDFVLDQVEPENVHHVTFSRKKGTQVRHIPNSMSEQEYDALRKYLRTEGSLGEYWRAGALTETP
jgi:hypothetical protein